MWITIGFVAGVVLVQQFAVLPGPWTLAGLIPVLAVCIRFRRLMAAAFGFGLLWASGYAAIRLHDALPVMAERQQALIEGTVLTIPAAMGRGVRFDFAIAEVLEPAGVKLPARVRLSWYEASAAPGAGQRWRLRVSLRCPRGMQNPGGFDYERWLFAQGVRAVGYVRKSDQNLQLGTESGLSPRVWRQVVYDRLSATLARSPVAGLIEALAMGVDDGITPGQWGVLRRTGTLHLIAVSGSHIGLIAAFVFVLTRWICAYLGVLRGSPPRLAAGAGFAAAWFYSALADFAIPTQRAMIMIGVAMGAVVLQRNPDLPHVLAMALLAVSLYDPLAVLSPGLWLSFGAVALIAYVLSGRIGTPSTGGALIRINWATALGLAPLLLVFFRQVSLVSPIANLLAVPVLGTLLIPVCLTGALLLLILPPAGSWLLHLAEFILLRIWPVLEWLSLRPWSEWTHAEPPPWTLPLALLGTLLILAPRGVPARWLGLVLLLPAMAFEPERPRPGVFRMTLLDVGQGLSAVVETRRRSLVFDTGARLGPHFDMGSAVIEPFLRQRGIGRLDALIVSHGDNDHIGGARSLLERFPVARIYAGVPERLAGYRVAFCRVGQRWAWDGVRFAMLGPVRRGEKGNDGSCVLRVSGRNGSALLTGDIERRAESLLLRRYGKRLRSEILVVPHHGSKTSSSREFLEAVEPKIALIPAGFLNRFGFPHRSVLARYRELKAEVLNTAETGAITAIVGDAEWGMRLETYRSAYRRYWQETQEAGGGD